MKKFFLSLVLAWGLVPAVLAFGAPALQVNALEGTYNPVDKACQANNQSAACKSQNSNNVDGPNGIIVRVTRLVAAFGAFIAVLVIVIYGFQMITSYGDSGKVTSARNAIIGAVIGLVVIALAQALVVFIVSNI